MPDIKRLNYQLCYHTGKITKYQIIKVLSRENSHLIAFRIITLTSSWIIFHTDIPLLHQGTMILKLRTLLYTYVHTPMNYPEDYLPLLKYSHFSTLVNSDARSPWYVTDQSSFATFRIRNIFPRPYRISPLPFSVRTLQHLDWATKNNTSRHRDLRVPFSTPGGNKLVCVLHKAPYLWSLRYRRKLILRHCTLLG